MLISYSFLILIQLTCLILTSFSFPACYKVTISSLNESQDVPEVGYYEITNNTNKEAPVYKKKESPVRFLLLSSETALWIISEDIAGKHVKLENNETAETPDMNNGTWIAGKRKVINGLKVTKTECNQNGLNSNHSNISPRSVVDKERDFTWLYVICGLLLVLILLIILICLIFWMKKKRNLAKQETVDENPDYGDHDCGVDSQIIDRNDYYYADV